MRPVAQEDDGGERVSEYEFADAGEDEQQATEEHIGATECIKVSCRRTSRMYRPEGVHLHCSCENTSSTSPPQELNGQRQQRHTETHDGDRGGIRKRLSKISLDPVLRRQVQLLELFRRQREKRIRALKAKVIQSPIISVHLVIVILPVCVRHNNC